jgi:hypothetical protein
MWQTATETSGSFEIDINHNKEKGKRIGNKE